MKIATLRQISVATHSGKLSVGHLAKWMPGPWARAESALHACPSGQTKSGSAFHGAPDVGPAAVRATAASSAIRPVFESLWAVLAN